MAPTLLLTWLALAAPAATDTLAPAVQAAIVTAVRARVGDDAEVVVTRVASQTRLTAEVTDAVLAPGATLGAPIEFVLRGAVSRGGSAALVAVGRVTVELDVVVRHWHVRGAMARGARLAESDLVEARHALPRGNVKRPLDEATLVDGRVLADLAADACLTARVVAPSPAVVAGRDVAAVVRVGQLEVRAGLVAVDSGPIGADVRVMHPESRRTFRARVIGRAQVEISHEP